MRIHSSAPRRRLATAAVLAALAAAPALALAATQNGITPRAPAAGAAVPEGKAVTFSGGVRGTGPVFVHVCRSARRAPRTGLICSDATIGKATKGDRRFSYRQPAYTYAAYWLNRPGVYYWQAHRIACEDGNVSDCRLEGPVVRFRVR